MAVAFFDHGARRLDTLVQADMLCAFDFDGTLAPIVTQPGQARLAGAVAQRLMRLAMLAPVAIITGRALDDIRSRLPFTPAYLIGNHGLEGLPDGALPEPRYHAICQVWKATLTAAFEDDGRFPPQIAIEDKHYSLSVHYRQVAQPLQVEHDLRQLFSHLTPPPRLGAGKFIFNLVPQGAPDKGVALEQLLRLSGAPSAIYVGDDVTDEDVFRLPRANLLTVRIEAHPASAAAFYLERQQDILTLLDELIDRLDRLSPPGP